MLARVADDLPPEVPKKRTAQRELRRIRIFLCVFTGFAAVMLAGLGLAAMSQADQPRAVATVTSLLPRTKACPVRALVSFSAQGSGHQVVLCAQSAVPAAGRTIEIRYSATRPLDDVAPAAEDRLSPIVPIPALFLLVGLAGLVFCWRRPDLVLRSGFRVRRYRG
jgi:hypothetical protein